MKNTLNQQAQSHMKAGIFEFEQGRLDQALKEFKFAAVASLGNDQPWFWMGRVYEETGDSVLAGHCFYMACGLGSVHGPSREALRRLGYYSAGQSGPNPQGQGRRLVSKHSSIQGVKP